MWRERDGKKVRMKTEWGWARKTKLDFLFGTQLLSTLIISTPTSWHGVSMISSGMVDLTLVGLPR